MLEDLYRWRCMCGEQENIPTDLDCRNCDKQRWSQLGMLRSAARKLVLKIYPAIKYREVAA